jgi:hypothetical protein
MGMPLAAGSQYKMNDNGGMAFALDVPPNILPAECWEVLGSVGSCFPWDKQLIPPVLFLREYGQRGVAVKSSLLSTPLGLKGTSFIFLSVSDNKELAYHFRKGLPTVSKVRQSQFMVFPTIAMERDCSIPFYYSSYSESE